MKIHIEVVTGFWGSGKTTFISSLLNVSKVESERIVIFQLEHGEIDSLKSSDLVKVISINSIRELQAKMIDLIKEYNPNRIIIEYNGTSSLKELFDILNDETLKQKCKITTFFFIADGKKLKLHINNIGSLIVPFIQCANMIVVNNIDDCNKINLEESFRLLKYINPKAFVLKVKNKYILKLVLKESKVIDNGSLKKMRIKIANSKIMLNKL